MTWVSVAWARDDDRRVAELLIRGLVARHYPLAVDRMRIGRICPRCASTAHGRPTLRGLEVPDPLSVSLARTPGVTVVALSPGPRLGVDVEDLDGFTTAGVASVVLHPDERATTAAELAVTWVRKEALLKASGAGLSVDPSSLRVAGRVGSPTVLEWAATSPQPDWLIDLTLAADLRAAVAGSGHVPTDGLTVQQAAPGGPLG